MTNPFAPQGLGAAATALALLLAAPAWAQDTTEDTTTEAPAEGEAATTEEAAPTDATEAPAAEEAAPAEGESAPAEAAAPAYAPDTIVASVNGTDITLAEVLMAVSALPAQYQQLPPDVLFGAIIDQLIQQELLAQAATTEPPTLAPALANQRRQVLANAAVGELVATALTPEALQAAYDAAYAAAEPMAEWNASHILVATAEEADAVIARLDAGEDFATVAAEVSTDTGSGAQGGALGWFSAGMMVPEFEEGVAALQPGEVSAPVESQFGFHVIRLEETREKPAPTLEEVRPELEGQVQQEAVQARLAELEAAGEVTRPEPGAFDPAAALDPRILQ